MEGKRYFYITPEDFKIAEEQLGLIKDYIINKFETIL